MVAIHPMPQVMLLIMEMQSKDYELVETFTCLSFPAPLTQALPSRLPAPARHNQTPGSADGNVRAAMRVSQTCLPSTCELEDLLEWDLSSWKYS